MAYVKEFSSLLQVLYTELSHPRAPTDPLLSVMWKQPSTSSGPHQLVADENAFLIFMSL